MKKIYTIFKTYKYKLLCIYFFMILTELSLLSQPYLLGKGIDGLINGSYFWLLLLGVSYFMSDFFNYKRMVYDTKVYTKIYRDIVLKFLQISTDDDSTKISRTNMAGDIVGVLEGYVHFYIATIITIIGSIGFIYSSNFIVGIVVSIAFLFILVGVLLFYKKIRQSIRIKNNHDEHKVKRIQQDYNQSVSFFNRKRKLDIFESTLQGKNWLVAGMIKHIFLFISIIILITTTPNITIGSVITVYSYVHGFLISMMSIPVSIEMYSRITDILKRIK